MNSALLRLFYLPRNALILFVKTYRLLLSPWLASACRFSPTCSAYSLHALKEHGAVVGGVLTVCRLARCQPWCNGGLDPVPTPARVQALFTRLLRPLIVKSPSLPLTPSPPAPSSVSSPEKNAS